MRFKIVVDTGSTKKLQFEILSSIIYCLKLEKAVSAAAISLHVAESYIYIVHDRHDKWLIFNNSKQNVQS